MISEDKYSQVDTKLDHAYTHLSDQEAIIDILCPDLNSDSDSDKDDSLFGTEWLDNLGVTDHIVSNVPLVKGNLATFIITLFNSELVSAQFNTGAVCSYILSSLYDQISKKVTMTKMHLRVSQADKTSLGQKV